MRRARSPVVRIARASKYHSRKVELDGFVFDSEAEARYYEELKHRQAMGEISGLKVHPRFDILDKFTDPWTGETQRKTVYEGDFLFFTPNGHGVVVDVKGMKTPEFRIKIKMARQRYPELEWRIVDTKGRGKK